MSSTRNFKSPGVFAENASTTIPPTPIAGVAYRDAVNGDDDTENGWRFGTTVQSQDWNQVMYLITSMLQMVDKQGILGWSKLVDYQPPAIVFGSNGLLYVALQASGPGTSVADPVSSPSSWERFAVKGRIVLSTTGPSVWTVPASMRLGLIKPSVKVIGAGAGGGRNNGTTAAPSGGGGGGIAESIVDLMGVTSVNVYVGAGGAGASSNGQNGSAGGASAFGLISATGGEGGMASGNQAGFGGMGSGGQVNYSVGSGSVPYSVSVAGFGGGGESPAGVAGSSDPMGPGQGGAGRINSPAPSGANGAVIIEW